MACPSEGSSRGGPFCGSPLLAGGRAGQFGAPVLGRPQVVS